ncbi:hypothetical protein IG631_19376 [Alternaria alternata]|nr:hypothetical protein IG631_19376 [Alternaria alternata]
MCSRASGRVERRAKHSSILPSFAVLIACTNWLSSSSFASNAGSETRGSAAGWGACTPSPSAHPEKSRSAWVAWSDNVLMTSRLKHGWTSTARERYSCFSLDWH